MTSSVRPADWPAGLVVPRFATPRDDRYRTMGPAVAKAARLLGKTLMPWQQLVADVAGEVDSAGRYRYPLVIVTVPRQSGKTTLDLSQSVQRCLQGPRRKVWHTAQTGQDARKKWGELVDDVMTSPLSQLVAGRPRRTNGAEALAFANGSVLRPHPPTRDALHGEQSDTNNVDEAWVFTEEEGSDLLQAITPTQLTRPGAQTFLWSTRGDAASTWFHGMIAQGYAGVDGVALFDWGIPDDADPTVETIARFHPALGHTVTLDSLRAAQVTMADRPSEYARAYGNRATGAAERVLPAEAVAAVTTTAELPAGQPAYGVGVSADGSWGAVVACVRDSAGTPWLEVLAHRPGRSWLVPYVVDLADPGAGVAGDRRGPAAPVLDQLALADDVTVLPASGVDFAAACQDFYDRVLDGRIRLRRHGALDAAADVAGRRLVADGGWVWSRAKSTGDVSALEAATWAAWAQLRQEGEQPAPFFQLAS